MADVQPLRALHYDLDRVGGLQPVVAPPYDVIDAEQRAALAARSPYNVVEIDLPEADGDLDLRPRRRAVQRLAARGRPRPRRRAGAVGARPGLHRARRQRADTRNGFFARVRVEDYGPGRIRPHERTHPGPKEDRLRLTRATRANLSPIFCALRRPGGRGVERARAAHRAATRGARSPTTTARVTGSGASPTPDAIAAVTDALATDRAADRRRPPPLRDRARLRRRDRRRGRAPLRADVPRRAPGPGPHRLPDPPPAHRPRPTTSARRCARRSSATSTSSEVDADDLAAHRRRRRPLALGYIDAHHRRPLRLTLKDQAIADAALPGHARALPPARHRRARGADPQGRARADRGRHLPPARARLRARHRPGARARRRPARPTPRSSCARRRSSRSATSPRPA